MRAVGVVFLALLAFAAAKPLLEESEYQLLFAKFVREYNKVYDSQQFLTRYDIFKAKYDEIFQHNLDASHTYTVGINRFADMTKAEFKVMLGYKSAHPKPVPTTLKPVAHPAKLGAPDSVDWRAQGAVTPVKNQGQCGSCWSFSTTGSTEGCVFLSNGTLTSLSEQQLVDCSTQNSGCNGGDVDTALAYVAQNGGLTSEDQYPYQAAQGQCNTGVTLYSTVSGSQDVTQGDENALLQAASQQPVSVAIEADQDCFQNYQGGVLNNPACGTNLDHAVLVVGYGTDPVGGDYWIVKNSWGADWGEQGYIRLARGVNQCGISQDATVPVGCQSTGN